MKRTSSLSILLLISIICVSVTSHESYAQDIAPQEKVNSISDGDVVKKVVDLNVIGENLLKDDDWRGWQRGFEKEGEVFACDNGSDSNVQRGVSQTVTLNQQKPEPIIATAWGKAENVGGGRNSDYSLYLDLVYTDDTPLWGQVDTFSVGTHDWEKAQVVVFPEKPVKSVSFHMLLRRHSGKAWFRNPNLKVIQAFQFDGIPAQPVKQPGEGFQVRDVSKGTDFVCIKQNALDLKLECREAKKDNATFIDVKLSDTSGTDRAVTLVYTVPLQHANWRWLNDTRNSEPVEQAGEYLDTTGFAAGANGRLSRYPFGAVSYENKGVALGIDMSQPAFFRVGYNTGTRELFIAYDLGLTPERSSAHLRFCKFSFDPKWKFHGALSRFYDLFPEHFKCRISKQGLWMPFAKISDVNDWQDFGFKFKEGANETKWDDQHDIITFRYTEPMTWWMTMPKDMPRNMNAAVAEARRLAVEKGDNRAKSLFTSGFHDEKGNYIARLLDTPWCNGAVWSMNSMPGIPDDVTDFKNKWNPDLLKRLYGPERTADLDGEYIDSSEGYVTDQLDFARKHFAYADTPLTFSQDTGTPAIFRGLIVFEYVRAIERDMHARGKYMMANGTPYRLCWLAPLLDVIGTETNWNPNGKWQPMSDRDLLYRRALCKGKPYCFLMNTPFEDFTHQLIEKYMKRCLAYGMFPGFFSHNASQGHYFTRPELYERDRNLFKKYVPLCKLIAEAGWQPITLTYSNNPKVYIERFGEKYLTVFNDSDTAQDVTITIENNTVNSMKDLVTGRIFDVKEGKIKLSLESEDVAVLEN